MKAKDFTQRSLSIVTGIDESALSRALAASASASAIELFLTNETLCAALDLNPVELIDAHLADVNDELQRMAARSRNRTEELQRAVYLAKHPVAQLLSRGWLGELNDPRDPAQVESAVRAFYQQTPAYAAKRSGDENAQLEPKQAAWLIRVRQLAARMHVSEYSAARTAELIAELRPLRASTDGIKSVPAVLRRYGIRFVVVQQFAGAKIDGICTWINDQPVVGMSCRLDRIDNFWFVLRHELAHVELGHGRENAVLDYDLEGRHDRSPEETAANERASEFCVPQRAIGKFVEQCGRFISESAMMEFAAKQGAHPGIVAGQLQRATGRYDRFRKHQIKVRHLLMDAQVVDGWRQEEPIE